jgi:hypothetical protein
MPSRTNGTRAGNGPAGRLRSWNLQLTLTRSDLDAMPAELRRQLLRYLEQGRAPGARGAKAQAARGKSPATPLERRQVTALLRDLSFHRQGKVLRRMLDRLALDDAGRQKLATALPARDRARLGHYLALLNRLAAKAAGLRALRLCCFVRGEKAYVIHPTTRQHLRDLLPGIEHAGEQEEPLWE